MRRCFAVGGCGGDPPSRFCIAGSGMIKDADFRVESGIV